MGVVVRPVYGTQGKIIDNHIGLYAFSLGWKESFFSCLTVSKVGWQLAEPNARPLGCRLVRQFAPMSAAQFPTGTQAVFSDDASLDTGTAWSHFVAWSLKLMGESTCVPTGLRLINSLVIWVKTASQLWQLVGRLFSIPY